MNKYIRQLFQNKNILNSLDNELKKWKQLGSPFPVPHPIKNLLLLEYKRKYNLKCLIESGTYQGEMIDAMNTLFNELHTIELSSEYFNKAQIKFKNNPKITVYNGDSGNLLPEILKKIQLPILFWLDGHYSGDQTAKADVDTPIIKEIDAISSYKHRDKSVIIIDDARLFTKSGVGKDYPAILEFYRFTEKMLPCHRFSLKWDSIILEPSDKY
jgi:hypothetical protein